MKGLYTIMPKAHKCHFPDCEYETDERSKIDYHHVIPRELNKRSKVTIPLCKTHHAMIYVPQSKSGQHSIKTEGSLIIHNTYTSTQGNSIHYESMDGDKFYWFPDTGDRWDD